MNMPNLLINTDMDGSLLDHHTYSHQPADAMLESLEKLGIPVIANTSKTFAELLQLRKSINNRYPFIAENGSAIYLPKSLFPEQPKECKSHDADYWVKEFCPPRSHWQVLLTEVKSEFEGEFLTFTDGGIPAIMEWTGLDEAGATLASQRQYGEPVRWLSTEQRAAEFTNRLTALGATVLMGGRFIHIAGKSDKGVAMLWLSELYMSYKQDHFGFNGHRPITLAIGDGANDIAMLNAADYALAIRSPANPALKLHRSKKADNTLVYSDAFGPEGWAEGVEKILGLLNIQITK